MLGGFYAQVARDYPRLRQLPKELIRNEVRKLPADSVKVAH